MARKTKAKSSKQDKLVLKFDPLTIEHLGLKMYSNISKALAELVANAYDADSKNVTIKLYTKGKNQRIEVVDDGDGMSFDEINEQFLRIGRNRRSEGYVKSPSGKRKATGKKGLGKLAFFGIGKKIEIETIKRKSGLKTTFTLDWNQIINTHDKDYEPKHVESKCAKNKNGTVIRLSELNKKLSLGKEELAVDLSRLFNFTNPGFEISIRLNNDKPLLVHNKLKYKNLDIEFQWPFPKTAERVKLNYALKSGIEGKIFSCKKPLKPGMRGISLFANGRLVNAPEFFGVSESSHAYSYFTGWLDVDFVDEWKEDVISTDRQTLNWNFQNTAALRDFLKKCMSLIEKEWHDKRNKAREKKIKEKTKVNVPHWYKHLPPEVLKHVKPIIDSLFQKQELPEDDNKTAGAVQKLHALVPEYPYFHWRHLHPTVQKKSDADYKKRDYYRALMEVVKKYINDVRAKSGSTNSSDSSMMGEAFGGRLLVAKKYKRMDKTDFSISTKANIEDGQKFLSMGIVSGARNPVFHEEISHLRDSGLFTEKDCLDALSLLSHLYRRLEDAETK